MNTIILKSKLILCKLNVIKQHFPVGGLNNKKYIPRNFSMFKCEKTGSRKSIRLLIEAFIYVFYWIMYLATTLERVLLRRICHMYLVKEHLLNRIHVLLGFCLGIAVPWRPSPLCSWLKSWFLSWVAGYDHASQQSL